MSKPATIPAILDLVRKHAGRNPDPSHPFPTPYTGRRSEREAEKAAATLAKETLAKVTANDPAPVEDEEEFVWPALGTSVPTHLRKDLGKTGRHQPLKYAEGL